MDLVYLKKKALLIPTPGQTEQEYLADYYKKENLFYSVSQDSLDLERDIEIATKLRNRNCIEEFHENIEINNINLFLDEIIRRNQH
jgi:hypothetical protein